MLYGYRSVHVFVSYFTKGCTWARPHNNDSSHPYRISSIYSCWKKKITSFSFIFLTHTGIVLVLGYRPTPKVQVSESVLGGKKWYRNISTLLGKLIRNDFDDCNTSTKLPCIRELLDWSKKYDIRQTLVDYSWKMRTMWLLILF